MQIPKNPRKQIPVEKKCAEPGCGAQFIGNHSAKYCLKHRNPQTRVKEKPVVEHVTEKNQVFEHNYTEVKSMIQHCALEGCNEQFEVKIFPRQYVYPKYCPEHRNEHKRKKHLEQLTKTAIVK